MPNNYNVDAYWKESFSSIINKNHFAKFLKGYPFQDCTLLNANCNVFFELSHIETKVEDEKKVSDFYIKYYRYVPSQGCYELGSNIIYPVKNEKDIFNLFMDTVCMDYEYYKKHNLGIPKIPIHPWYNLHLGELNCTESYFFLCDVFNYDTTTKSINLGLTKIMYEPRIRNLFSEQIYLSGSIYDLYIKTVYKQDIGLTIKTTPLTSAASVLDRHLVYLEELWKEFLEENKAFIDELTNRSIQWN